MGNPQVSDQDLISLIRQYGVTGAAKKAGVSVRNVNSRRVKIERTYGKIDTPSGPSRSSAVHHPHRAELNVLNGVVLIASDAHYWPGHPSTAHRAFLKFCKGLKPVAVIMNGDVIDASTISRHPPIGWEGRPTLVDEIDAAKARLHEVCQAAPKSKKFWTLGNHDARFETRLATVAPEYARLLGVSLSDHFPAWTPCWAVRINETVAVKHRFKGGQGATRANTLNAGLSMVTGHLHSQNVTALTDYKGTRYGVDSGCLADPSHKAFVDYTEDAPLDWRSGFAVLTFKNGKLLRPELVSVWGQNEIEFRGELHKV